MRGRTSKFLSVLAVVMLLGACTNKDKGGVVADGGLGSEDRVEVSDGVDRSGLNGVTPGSQ
ncbi:MAG: hypothetical protein RBS08_05660, partial [Bdellovibrionales bacterium]|nr:hypothetical protein [Bdellovibrionales bacterium]